MSKMSRLLVIAVLFIFLFSMIVIFNPEIEETEGYADYNYSFTGDSYDYRI